ncbi:MAG TPA: hypothetical protein DHV62_00865 [Elusimicrobia bacterium]|jgi:putative nucleotidyltransferase with HDIG domain|nr:hypothetical protein [Elusimicrobiota bacterium]
MEKEQLQEFYELARELSGTLDLDTLLKKIGLAAEKLTHAEASSILLLDEDKEHLYFKTAGGEKGGIIKKLKVKIGQGIAGWVAKERKTLVVQDVTKDERFAKSFDKSTGFITKSILCVPLILHNELVGVAEVLNKKNGAQFTPQDQEVFQSLSNLAAIYITNAKFAETQRNFFTNIIEILAVASESREPNLTGHTRRIAQRALAIARELDFNEREYQNLYYAALLHDIGYLIPGDRNVRNLNHPSAGVGMVRGINFLAGAAPIIRGHHENYDGSGFPDNIKGENIPLGARIIALLEAVEETGLTIEEVERFSGTKFDPQIVKLYLEGSVE